MSVGAVYTGIGELGSGATHSVWIFSLTAVTEELCGKLTADVREGLSIADAYARLKQAEKDAEIAELKRQLEAERQNNKNKAKAVGSQRDSGGRRTKNAEDDFFAAFEK